MESQSTNSGEGSRSNNTERNGVTTGGPAHDAFLMKIEKRRWKAVRRQLKSNKGKNLVLATGCYGISSLSMALGYNAPLDIIEEILNLRPELGTQRDVLRANPLHVACLNGADFSLIKLLIDRYPRLVQDFDTDLRTPLHHAVEYTCRLQRVPDEDREGVFDVIQLLLDIRPDIVHWVDKNGDSPIDLTHIVMVDTDTSSLSEDQSIYNRVETLYQQLKQVSINVYLRKKRRWEEQGYDTTKMPEKQEEKTDSVDTEETKSAMDSETKTGCT